MEYLLTTEQKGRTAEVYRETMRKLRRDPPEFVRDQVTSRRRSLVQEKVEYKHGDFHCRA